MDMVLAERGQILDRIWEGSKLFVIREQKAELWNFVITKGLHLRLKSTSTSGVTLYGEGLSHPAKKDKKLFSFLTSIDRLID